MRDSIDIGSSPADEDCAQVGSDNYSERARKECKALINQMRREMGNEQGSAQFKIKANPHDFGSYYEVVVYFDSNDEKGIEYAFAAEKNLPARWDAQAREELGI
jgi:hypothetical protein